MTSIAFIGFGEAGGLLATGLLACGAEDVATYDILIDDPATAGKHKKKAADIGVTAAISPAEAVAGRDVVISAVVSSETVKAAASVAPHLKAEQYYLDINSASPRMKREAQAVVEQNGAHYVEAAVMDLVPPHGHRVPMFLAGTKAADLAPILTALDMRVEPVGDKIGQASSIKMVRSVFLKGFSAILLECLVAAERAGVEDKVLASIQRTFPEIDWIKMADYYMGRLTVHAKRQSAEMWEVVETLRDMDVDPFTAEASAKRLAWLAELDILKNTPDGEPPKDFKSALKLFREVEAKTRAV